MKRPRTGSTVGGMVNTNLVEGCRHGPLYLPIERALVARKNPWFRLYVETVSDRKIRRLDVAHRWLWIAVLTAASTSPKPGQLLLSDGDALDATDLADLADLPLRTVKAGMLALEQRGLVQVSDACYSVPKWAERQSFSDSSAERTRQWRERKRDGAGTSRDGHGDVTRDGPDTETEAETDNYPPTPLLTVPPVDNRSASHGHIPFTDEPAVDPSVAALHLSLQQTHGTV